MKRNKIEIRILGLQRSGNHAIVDWIMNQHKGARTCFLNNVRHGNYDPFCNASQAFVYNCEGFPDGKVRGFQEDNGEPREFPDELRNAQKDLLIYSYEDDRRLINKNVGIIDGVYSKEFEEQRAQYLGVSEDFIDVLIVRDPYNLFASRLKKMHHLTGIDDVDLIIDFTKDILREASNREKAKNSRKIVLKYNQWFSDQDYRRHISQQLRGKFNDESLKHVSSMGGGSSFDGIKFNSKMLDLIRKQKWKKLFKLSTYDKLGDKLTVYWPGSSGARQMKVLERWKGVDDPRMQKVLNDPEIFELSKSLFGDILTSN